MAENKTSFVLYADLIHTVKKMPKEKAGDLFLTILSYVNDENPLVEDMLVDLVFEPIKRQLKRDLEKYEHKRERLSQNGRAGGIKSAEIRQANQQQIESIGSNCKQIEGDTANDTVNDTVTDNVISIAGEHDKTKIIEFLRTSTDRRFITDEQIDFEAEEFKAKYDGMKIGNLKTLCNTWAGNIRPWQKQDKKLSSFI